MVTVPSLSYAHPVDRSLVHKRDASEVFPTDLVAAGPDEMWAALQWPSDHPFYTDPAERVDTYLLLETIRQMTIYACHQHYRVPPGAHFIMSGLGSTSGAKPGSFGNRDRRRNAVARLKGTNVRRSPAGALQSVRMEFVFCSGDKVFATGHGDAMIVTDRVYARLRRGRTEILSPSPRDTVPTIAPHAVGHTGEGDVLLGTSPAWNTYTLSIDFGNLVLFDHPLDHIAGMIPVEASRQMMRVHTQDSRLEFGESEFRFHHALEFGSPIIATLGQSDDRLSTSFVQDGRLAVSGEFTSRGQPSRRSSESESQRGLCNH